MLGETQFVCQERCKRRSSHSLDLSAAEKRKRNEKAEANDEDKKRTASGTMKYTFRAILRLKNMLLVEERYGGLWKKEMKAASLCSPRDL